MAYNLIIQKNGAHTETIATFVELLSQECQIFYPTVNSEISYETAISERYGVDFIKGGHQLHMAIDKNKDDHGVMVFNTAAEIKQEWVKPFLEKWEGIVVVYHHEADHFDDPSIVQFYAHPFIDREAYLLPVSNIFDSAPAAQFRNDAIPQIVLPNWSRPAQILNKNIDLLRKISDSNLSESARLIMTGMSLDVMREALSDLPSADRIEVMHKTSFGELRDLLLRNRAFIMPLIKPNGRYDRLGLTGSIPLALNHGCPLLISKEVARKYELNFFIEEFSIFNVDNIASMDYFEMRNSVIMERRRIISSNILKFISRIGKSKGFGLEQPSR